MKPGWWERVKKMVHAFAGRSGRAVEPSPTMTPTPTQSVTQSESAPTGDQEGAATVAIVRPPSRVRKTARSLARGQTVAERFRVLRFVNSGGMGEVFEAWDSELGERVALKTIRPEIGSLSAVIERFKQEVRQTRGISHVNVCRVYEVFSHVQETGERIWFLTMELLEGQTLSERLRQQGPIPPKQALALVEQMVAGLAAAHELGIVHRDFKSSNIMLVETSLGKTRAVVTDFGLSLKLLTGQHTDPEEARQGTPRYMAPEQAEGGDVGFAADQYSLGVVMCEMLTGKSPLPPEPTTRAVLPEEHDLSPRWESVVRRCLEYRPEDRFPDIRDVATALSPVRRHRTAWIVGTVAALILLSFALLAWFRQDNVRLEEVAQLTPSTDYSGQPSLSKDGKIVAYSSDRAEAGNTDIWVQRLPSGSPIRLTTDPAEDVDPSLSPDGTSVAFRSHRDGGGIYLVDVNGGNERLLVPGGRDPKFSPDGRSIAYWVGDPDRTIPTAQFFVISLADGSSVRLARDFKDARFPVWSSDGQYILFIGCRTEDQPMPTCSEWWVTNRDGTRVRNTGALSLLRREQIQPVESLGSWHENNAVFSARHGGSTGLWQLKIRESTLAAVGPAHQFVSGYARNVDELSIADNGEVAFSQLLGAMHVWVVKDALASKPVATKITQDPVYDVSPFISHNGRWLVFSRGVGHRDIWLRDVVSGHESAFFESAQDKGSAIVDDSGAKVVFETHNELEGSSLSAVVRSGSPRSVCTNCSRPSSWFDGNRAILYQDNLPSRIRLHDLETDTDKIALASDNVSLGEASWSPENQYLLFSASSPGGAKRIFAVFFPRSTASATGEWIPITDETTTADRGRWSGDGKYIFYLSTRDGWPCIWGQNFDPQARTLIGPAFPIIHLHNPRISPESIAPYQFQLSAAGNSVYFNLGEASAAIWIGRFRRPGLLSFFRP